MIGPTSSPTTQPSVTADHLEPLLALALAAHGVCTALLVIDTTPVEKVGFAVAMVLGLLGVAGWRGRIAIQVRAVALTLVAFTVQVMDPTMVPHMLYWWYAIIAVYPLFLAYRQSLALCALTATALMLQYPFGAASPGSTLLTWLLRVTAFAVLGLIVTFAGDRHRRAQATARQRQDEAEQMSFALRHAAEHDTLTGLPNRGATTQMIDHALALRSGEPGDEVGILLFDLDRFKHVNESLGHFTGDLLLRDVADRVAGALEVGQYVTRLGGDEFVLICSGCDERRAHDNARRLVDLFREPLIINASPYQVSLSIGVTVSGGDLQDSGEMLRAADAAMYAAKAAGRGRAVSYDQRMRDAVESQLELERQLQTALTEGSTTRTWSGEPGVEHGTTSTSSSSSSSVQAAFQPVVDLRTGRVVSAEALARWEVDGKSVSPAEFVPLAEELGLGRNLTRLIARQSAQALALWHSAGLTEVRTIAVNVGPDELLQPSLGPWLADLVASYGLPQGSLSLEITERDVVVDANEARQAIERLGEYGITVAVDDFGTGFSSLAYLAQLPLNVLKIDRAFVEGIEQDPTIARMVVYLARSFGMGCIAEGVETVSQLRVLQELGVDSGQGWLLGRPVSTEAFCALAAAPVNLGSTRGSAQPTPA